MSRQRIDNAHDFAGGVTFPGGVTLPTVCVSDAQVAAAAGITHDKLEHQHAATYAKAGTAATETVAVFVARSAGTVLAFKAGAVGPCVGDSTITFDLRKNGTTVLTGVVTVDSGDAAYALVDGTLVASPTFVAGDVLTVVVTATVGTGTLGTGPFASVRVKEGA